MNKNILIIVNVIPPFFGGGGKRALNTAKSLTENGFDVTILTHNYNGFIKGNELVNGVKINWFNIRKYNRIFRLLASLKIGYWLISQKKKFHSIHIYGIASGFYFAALYAKISKSTLIYFSTMYGTSDPYHALYKSFWL